jgi:hypothetical protein
MLRERCWIGSFMLAPLALLFALGATQPCAADFALEVTATPKSLDVIEGTSGVFTFTIRNTSTEADNLNIILNSVLIGDIEKLGAGDRDDIANAKIINNNSTKGTVLGAGETSTFQVSFDIQDQFPDSDKDPGLWRIWVNVTAFAQSDPTVDVDDTGSGNVQVTDPSQTGPVSNPEPASLTTVGIGVLCLAGYAWRRRKTKSQGGQPLG